MSRGATQGGLICDKTRGWPTERVLRRIRAISPVPGLAVEVSGLRFFVTRAETATDYVAALEPGEASDVRSGSASETLTIRTADGAIAVLRATLTGDGHDDEEEAEDLDRHALAHTVANHLARLG